MANIAPNYLRVADKWLARNQGVHLLKDSLLAGPAHYAVARTYKNVVFSAMAELTEDFARYLFDCFASSAGPEGDSYWCAVLDRLMKKPATLPGIWLGSAGEYASRFFTIGSWNWLVTVSDLRKRQEAVHEETTGA